MYNLDTDQSHTAFNISILTILDIDPLHIVLSSDILLLDNNNHSTINVILNVGYEPLFQGLPHGHILQYTIDINTLHTTQSILESYGFENDGSGHISGAPRLSAGSDGTIYMTWRRWRPSLDDPDTLNYDFAIKRQTSDENQFTLISMDLILNNVSAPTERISNCLIVNAASTFPVAYATIAPVLQSMQRVGERTRLMLFWQGCTADRYASMNDTVPTAANDIYSAWFEDEDAGWSEPVAVANDNDAFWRGGPVALLSPTGAVNILYWEVGRSMSGDGLRADIIRIEVNQIGAVVRKSVLGPSYRIDEGAWSSQAFVASKMALDGEFGIVSWEGWENGERRVGVTRFRLTDGPVARDDYVSVEVGGVIDLAATQNDSHTAGDPLVIIGARSEDDIAVRIMAAQQLRVDATAAMVGRKLVTYVVRDRAGVEDEAQVVIDVESGAVETEAREIHVEAVRGRWTIINVFSNDPGASVQEARVIGGMQPEYGEIVINADQTISYRSAMTAPEMDRFAYVVEERGRERSTGTVYVEIRDPEDRTEVGDLNVEVHPEEVVVVNVFVTVAQERLTAPRILHMMGPNKGSAWVRADQMIVYAAPDLGEEEDIISFRANVAKDETIAGRIVFRKKAGVESEGVDDVGEAWRDGTLWSDGKGWGE